MFGLYILLTNHWFTLITEYKKYSFLCVAFKGSLRLSLLVKQLFRIVQCLYYDGLFYELLTQMNSGHWCVEFPLSSSQLSPLFYRLELQTALSITGPVHHSPLTCLFYFLNFCRPESSNIPDVWWSWGFFLDSWNQINVWSPTLLMPSSILRYKYKHEICSIRTFDFVIVETCTCYSIYFVGLLNSSVPRLIVITSERMVGRAMWRHVWNSYKVVSDCLNGYLGCL